MALDRTIAVGTPIYLYPKNKPMTMANQTAVTGLLRLDSIYFTRDADIEKLNFTELKSKQKYSLKGPRTISLLDWFLKGIIPSWYKYDEEKMVEIKLN
jgi:hypothetical protein